MAHLEHLLKSDKDSLEAFAQEYDKEVEVCPMCGEWGIVVRYNDKTFCHEIDLITHYKTRGCLADGSKLMWNFLTGCWEEDDRVVSSNITQKCECNIMIGPCSCGVFEMEKRNI
jgi:hypothetical protein